MSLTIDVLGQILIALGILNVWIVRSYGLPFWMWRVVGVTEFSLALVPLLGIAFRAVVPVAAGAMALATHSA